MGYSKSIVEISRVTPVEGGSHICVVVGMLMICETVHIINCKQKPVSNQILFVRLFYTIYVMLLLKIYSSQW